MEKYSNISDLFGIIDITDSYILVKEKGIVKKVYIYEIEPVTFLNFSIDVQSNVLNLYSEFLHESNLNFQMYISNKKMNIKAYVDKIKSNIRKDGSKKYKENVEKYILSIASTLENQKIYTTKYYIVTSLDSQDNINIIAIDKIIKKIDATGCICTRVTSKKKLEKLMYESINKEVVV